MGEPSPWDLAKLTTGPRAAGTLAPALLEQPHEIDQSSHFRVAGEAGETRERASRLSGWVPAGVCCLQTCGWCWHRKNLSGLSWTLGCEEWSF